MMDEVCKKCDNYLKITFLGKTVECCGGNVDYPIKCTLRKHLYEKREVSLTKQELVEATGIKHNTLMTILCRAEFSHIKKYVEDKKVYFVVTLKDIDTIKEFHRGRHGQTTNKR